MKTIQNNSYRNHYLEEAKATALGFGQITTHGDLQIKAEAIDWLRSRGTIYWKDTYSVAIAKGLEGFKLEHHGKKLTIEAYAQAQETYAYGIDNSEIYLVGESGKDVNIKSTTRITGTHDPAWGMKNSTLKSGEGNDIIQIMADAGATSISGSYRQAQTIKSFGAENSSISTGAGDDKLRIEAISRKSNFNVWSDRRNGNQDAGRWDSGWRSEDKLH